MAISQTQLPEGTDSIIAGSASDDVTGDTPGFTSDTGYASAGGSVSASSGTTSSSTGSTDAGASSKLNQAAAKVGDATAGLREQATDKAYGFVSQGKERAVGMLDNVTQLVEDAASQIDEKVGEQYGGYARQASQTVSGYADALRNKDAEELVDDARELIRKSPAIAIGAAAAIGFVVARLLKVGLSETARPTAGTTTDSPYVAPTAAPAATPSTATTLPVDAAF